ncbi:tandem-95 repeat protein [Agrobacterium sp. LMR679]|nr:tandem-95 repeat protein [Agrobacterium sp. LMR679]MCZ4072401.1 tandem-95 repeat protein [Agrobacterium sp. LMR679]
MCLPGKRISPSLRQDSSKGQYCALRQSLSRSADGGRIIELPGGRWRFVPNENVSGPISFSYMIGDGRKTSTGKIIFNIAAVNDAPIANADGAGTMNDPEGVFRTKQNQTIVVDFSALVGNDRDVEADSFEIVEILDADQGTVVQVGSTAVFTPNAGYIGDAGFHYRVTDSHGASSIGYATLLVMPLVPLPIPVSDFGFEVLEDSFIDIEPAALMANDYVPEGSTITFVGLEGAARLESGTYRVTPAADFNGELILSYSVQNEQGFPVSTTVTINVLPVADAPVARADTLEMNEDLPLTVFASQLLANDSDADRQAFVFTRVVGASGVTVSDLGFGQLRIMPGTDFSGAAWFDYEIEDSTGRTATARVDIAIAPVNDVPVIAAMPVLKGTEDQPFRATLPNGFVTDVDGDALLVELRGKGGSALPSPLTYEHETRTLSGIPPTNFNGLVQLEIAVSDGKAHTVRDLLVFIAPVNDTPVVTDLLPDIEVDEDRSFSVALPTRSFSDGDGDDLSYAVSLTNGLPLPAWMSVVNGNLIGTPPANFNGVIELAMTASDSALSATGNFRFLVRPVNDAPVLVHALADYTGQQARPIDVGLDKSIFADVDGDALVFTAQLADGGQLPSWLTFNGSGFIGTPPQTYFGSLDIEVAASDGSLVTYGLFRLSIVPTNQAPVLARPLPDVSVQEDHEISFAIPAGAFTDGDGDPLTYSAVLANGNALPEWLTFDGTWFTGTPPANFNGVIAIAVTAGDGLLSATSTFRLTVAPVNDAPVLKLPLADVSSPEDTPVDISISATAFTDVDGDPLVYSATLGDGKALPNWLNFDGARLTGMPPVNYNGAIDIKVTASEGSISATSMFRLTITTVNDAPAIANLLPDVVLPSKAPVSIPIPVDIFKDADGDGLTLSATLSDGKPLPSWLRLSNGRIFGTPPSNFTGALDIQVTASDGALRTSDVFRLTVKATNVAPAVAVPLRDVSLPEDTEVSITIPAGSFTDRDGNPLIYTAKLSSGAILPSWLKFDGTTFTGTPPANYNGVFDIKVTASDGSLSVDDVFRLTIKPVNDAPVLTKPLPDVNMVEDKAVWITIPAGSFTDVEKTSLTYSAALSDGSPLPSWLIFNGLTFIGTPPLNFNGIFDIKVTASDGLLSVSDVFKLVITPVNDKPVAVNDGPFSVTRGETLAGPTGALLGNDVDPDGDPLFVLSVGGARMGTVKMGADGLIQYTPDFGYEGTDSFVYLVSDGRLTAFAAVRLTVSSPFDGWTQGTENADTLSGDNGVLNRIFGGRGNDTISGGDQADRLAAAAATTNSTAMTGGMNSGVWLVTI